MALATFHALSSLFYDRLDKLAFKVAFKPDLAPDVYARARTAVDLALVDEPDNPFMSAALGAVLYRQGEYALAAETLRSVQEALSRSPQHLAKKIAPMVHAFGALAHARLGDDAVARAGLEALRAAFDADDPGEEGRALLGEIEALLEHTPSSTGDG